VPLQRLAPEDLDELTGMRRGEVLGLRWGDVELDAKRLSVQRALVNIAYELELVDVKIASGRRGHANVAFTMNVSQHVLPVMQADAAAVFSDAVFGAR
jgi:hypothetical protein